MIETKIQSQYPQFFYILDVKTLHIANSAFNQLPIWKQAYLRFIHDKLWMLDSKRLPKVNLKYILHLEQDKVDSLIQSLVAADLLFEDGNFIGCKAIDDAALYVEDKAEISRQNGKEGGRKPKKNKRNRVKTQQVT